MICGWPHHAEVHGGGHRARDARHMGDAVSVGLALATAAGALAPRPFPVAIAGAATATCLAARHPLLLCLAAAVLASSLSTRAWAGLEPPRARPVDARVTLVGDPDQVRGAVRAYARLGHRRVELWARGTAAGALAPMLAGEQATVSGRLTPLRGRSRAWLAWRHVAARVQLDAVRLSGRGGPVIGAANRLRRLMVRGATVLPADARPLFTGFVLGDDRGQRPEQVDDFRASGLSHLLVVSGGNVAFVLALAGLGLRRVTMGWRLAGGLAVLGGFGVLTRWEPSVLRAEAMAAIALLAVVTGRRQSAIRVLALAVAGLLLVDPLLAHSVGFGLSVGASAGIALLGEPLTRVLPGPRPVAAALGVTLAAQLGVAPLLVPVFGGVPVVSLPANLVALPAAGPVVMWGMVAGIPAGLLGGPAASVLHLPTRVLVGWIAGVARVSASLPLGDLGAVHVAVLGGCVAAAVTGGSGRPRLRRGAILVGAAVLAVPGASMVAGSADASGLTVVRGAQLWRRDGATVLVLDVPDGAALLGGLRDARVRHLDVVVARSDSRSAGEALLALGRRVPIGTLIDRSAPAGWVVPAGALEVHVDRVVPRLDVSVVASGRSPPRQ